MTVPIYSSFAAISPLPTPYAACTASDAHFGHASAHLFMAYSVATSSPDIGHPAVVSSRANAAAVMASCSAATTWPHENTIAFSVILSDDVGAAYRMHVDFPASFVSAARAQDQRDPSLSWRVVGILSSSRFVSPRASREAALTLGDAAARAKDAENPNFFSPSESSTGSPKVRANVSVPGPDSPTPRLRTSRSRRNSNVSASAPTASTSDNRIPSRRDGDNKRARHTPATAPIAAARVGAVPARVAYSETVSASSVSASWRL